MEDLGGGCLVDLAEFGLPVFDEAKHPVRGEYEHEHTKRWAASVDAADAFIAEVRDELGLPLVGLMCIPPLSAPPAPHFTCLAEIARRNGLGQLSMGMSADFEEAIRFGATHVRVGTAVF